MAGCNVAGDVKPQAHPAWMPHPRTAASERWLERTFAFGLGDSGAVVDHLEGDLFSTRDGPVSIDDAIDEAVQVDRVFVSQPRDRFEPGRGIQVVQQRAFSC